MQLTKYAQEHVGPHECEGSTDSVAQPSNRYHPQQEAWLRERKLYTGRMQSDIAHLPPELKFL
jgi:hypothetical protein